VRPEEHQERPFLPAGDVEAVIMELSAGVLAARHEGTERILARLLADEPLLYTKTRNYYRTALGHDLKDLPE